MEEVQADALAAPEPTAAASHPQEPAPPVSADDIPAAAALALARLAAHHGEALLGPALGPPRREADRVVQYHRNLVLEWSPEGVVRPRPLGALDLAGPAAPAAGPARRPLIIDSSGLLPMHAGLRYPRRSLAQLRYLVVHHSGADARLDPASIAAEHVGVNGWPGIGYHFCIHPDGRIEQCQDLTVSSHHVAQFNPVAVGIALLGDLRRQNPPPAQLDACADLAAWLCTDLGLPRQAIRGHGELVSTDCPGPGFLASWKGELLEAIRRRQRPPEAAPAA